MIKLKRIEAPIQLTDETKQKLTNEFKLDHTKPVWSKPYIREQLMKMSNSKCCYCEELIGVGCNEMHVEHFHDKNTYRDEVVEWENLFPSCSHCNKSKSGHDTRKYPIINPTTCDPKEIFYIKNYRYYSYNRNLNSLGRLSISVLGINDTVEKITQRYTLGNDLSDKLNEIYEELCETSDLITVDIRKRNRILKKTKSCLRMCLKNARFGACMATILQESDDYKGIRDFLLSYNLWDDELEMFHIEALEICMSRKKFDGT